MANIGAKHFVSPSVQKNFEDDEDYRKQIEVFKKFGFEFFDCVYDRGEDGWCFAIKDYFETCKKINEIAPGELIF